MSDEELEKLGTIRVDIHATRRLDSRIGLPADGTYAEVDKDACKKANSSAMVTEGRQLGIKSNAPRLLSYYERATDANRVGRMVVHYIAESAQHVIFGDGGNYDEDAAGGRKIAFSVDDMAVSLSDMFGLGSEYESDLKAGLRACKVEDMQVCIYILRSVVIFLAPGFVTLLAVGSSCQYPALPSQCFPATPFPSTRKLVGRCFLMSQREAALGIFQRCRGALKRT